MLNFSYCNPTRIIFGAGQIAQLGKQVPAGATVLMLYGGGSIKHNGVYAQVTSALAGRRVLEFGGIEPNPGYETLMDAVALARAEKVDYLLAVGGGSVIDASKFVAAAVPFAGEPWDILAKRAPIESALPLGCVLTLPATGSESNNGAVITRKATHDKLSFLNDKVQPLFAILDPRVTLSLPPKQVSNGVVDAFVHVVEQYLTYPVDAPVQDRFAEGLLLTLIEQGPRALAEPGNVDVCGNIMWAANLALNGLIGCGVPQDWATHMLGHELTALYGIDHARSLAIVLPAMLSVRKAAKRDKLLQYAQRVWGLRGDDADALIDQAIACTRDFFVQMQVPVKLADYRLGAEAIDAVCAQLEKHRMVKLGERRDVTLDVSRQVLELCR